MENQGFNAQKNQGYGLLHKFSRVSPVATCNYYQCLQIAHMIDQYAHLIDYSIFIQLLPICLWLLLLTTNYYNIMLAAQEKDFAHFTGKLKFTAKIAADYGICPIAIFWVRPKGWHIFINLVFLSFQSLNEAIYNDIILRPEHINALFPGRTDQIQAS